jgi:class 3 adenylate cyclase
MAVHRTILVVDVEAFCHHRRTNLDRVAVRAGLYRCLRQSFRMANISWAGCRPEDLGDGVLFLAPAEVPKSLFVEGLPGALREALHAHNATHPAEQQIRLRMALHAGEVTYDDHGATAAAINLTFRLLDATEFKAELASSPATLAVITSTWFFDEVVRNSSVCDRLAYRQVHVAVKETRTAAWIHLPEENRVGRSNEPAS